MSQTPGLEATLIDDFIEGGGDEKTGEQMENFKPAEMPRRVWSSKIIQI